MAADVVVVGAGVNGLTCALLLSRAGHDVRVVTRDDPQRTTSGVAAAMWAAYRVSHPRVRGWSEVSFHRFMALAGQPDTGVVVRSGIELFPHPAPDRWWPGDPHAFRPAGPADLPDGYVHGWCYEVPVVEMPEYLRWLTAGLGELGVVVERRELRSLTDAEFEVVVNCSGLGARTLAGDDSVHPVRGQVVRIERNGIERFVLDEHGPHGLTYVIPRTDDCICGGTAQEGEWSTDPDPATAADILRRCAALEPRVASAAVLEHRVGLRPGRPEVRLEAERLPDGRGVVHNYGHGGSGVTLSWGCAEDVVRAVDDLAG